VATAVTYKQLGTDQTIAANHTLRRPHGLNGSQTLGADGDPGNIVERSATEPAIGREEDGKNVTQQGLQGRDEEGTLPGALLSLFSI